MDFFYDDTDGDILIVRADGGLSRETTSQFVKELEALVEAGLRKIVVDCQKLTYVSSYGLSILLRIHRKMSLHGGDVKLAGVPGTLAQLLNITRLSGLFEIYEDVNRAKLEFRDKANATT